MFLRLWPKYYRAIVLPKEHIVQWRWQEHSQKMNYDIQEKTFTQMQKFQWYTKTTLVCNPLPPHFFSFLSRTRILEMIFFIPLLFLNHLNMKSHEFSKTKERQKSVKNRSAMMTFLPDILLNERRTVVETFRSKSRVGAIFTHASINLTADAMNGVNQAPVSRWGDPPSKKCNPTCEMNQPW